MEEDLFVTACAREESGRHEAGQSASEAGLVLPSLEWNQDTFVHSGILRFRGSKYANFPTWSVRKRHKLAE